MRTVLTIHFAISLLTALPSFAATYYVSPSGNDGDKGTSAEHPWKSAAKVNATSFQPGDIILFQRGGEWHERLQASSDGKPGFPIVYDAYGTGAKPKFLGSEILVNADFTAVGGRQFSYKIATQADTALQDRVFIPATWNAGVLTITVSTDDPRTDGKLYTACVRGNVLFSNRKSHLVFRNLVVDETAAQLADGGVQGYGVRIEGSTDVVLDSCEAYRCGRHHFAAINSTGFVGRHLQAAYAQPNTPGGNSFYVSYADAGAPVAACTSEWDDISASNIDDGSGGRYAMFVSHGDHQGTITMKNVTSIGKISFMSAPVIVKGGTLRDNASIENFGSGVIVDGVTLLDTAAIDQWSSGGTIQNCVARITPAGRGPTGYGAVIVLRDKAKQNAIRFNTLLSGSFSCFTIVGENSATKCYGNILFSDETVVGKPSGKVGSADFSRCDFNFYSPRATFARQSLKEWQAAGFDGHSQSGDPKLTDPAHGLYTLTSTSPCRGAARIKADDIPPLDAAGTKRANDIGAIEFIGGGK